MLKQIRKYPAIKWTLLVLAAGIALFFLLFGSIYFGVWGKIPSSKDLTELKQNKATQVLASNGKLIGKFYIFDRQPIDFDQFPTHLIEALIATEDARFYEHDGIDNRSLLRVFVKSILLQDDSAGGGSTISLQLAKNIYGRKDYGPLGIVVNKLQEAIIAKRLEDIYSKDEILELYFNTVPFSDNTYGIESASLKFFNKHTSALTLTESAVLVGMLKASHYYNPRIFPERSRLRRDVVLMQMAKYGFLDSEEAEDAKLQPLILDYKSFSHDKGIAPYFREQIRKDVSKILDTLKNKDGDTYNIYRDGLIVHTTLNYDMQKLAEEAMLEHMSQLQKEHENSYGNYAPWKKKEILNDAVKKSSRYQKLLKKGLSEKDIMARLQEKRPTEVFTYQGMETKNISTLDSLSHYLKFLNAGLLAVKPKNGAVQAWVGGVDYRFFKYDHVMQSKRQVGSTFKPFVYTAALENGMDPCSYFSVREVTYENGWTPSNSSSEGDDPHMNYNLKTALSKSMNTIAVKVLMETGIENVIQQAQRMGIESELPEYPSLALGTASLGLNEMAGAYTSYVNNGYPSKPYYITKIEDAEGNLLARFEPKVSKNKAFAEDTRKIMLNMMEATVNEGTAVRLRYKYGLKNDIAGKTGTTQNNKDGWFVGITPELVCVTWVGSDDHRIGLRNTSIGQGANSALPIFARLMQKMNAEPTFSSITRAKFEPLSHELAELMECPPQERDNFLERLFSGKKEKDDRSKNDRRKKKKKGFFKRLFGKKDDN